MKFFRSVTVLLLLFALLLSFVGCGKGYRPVKSSEEELVTTLSFGEGLDVPYELYRFYFLSELSLAGKDPATMAAAEKKAYFDEIHEKTLDELGHLYAVKNLCAKYGIDIESDALDEAVQEDVNTLVDETYGGDHDKYLAALRDSNMNDSVFRTVLRLQKAEKLLGDHMRDKSVIKSDAVTVKKYIESDECIRVSWIYISHMNRQNYNQMQLDTMEMEAQSADNETFMRLTHSVIPDTYTDDELDTGFYIGRYQLDPYYEELTNTAFSLAMGETSDWVTSGDGIYLVRRLPKDEAYVNDTKNLADFAEYYLLNSYYKILAEEKARLVSGVRYDASFSDLSFDTVKKPS